MSLPNIRSAHHLTASQPRLCSRFGKALAITKRLQGRGAAQRGDNLEQGEREDERQPERVAGDPLKRSPAHLPLTSPAHPDDQGKHSNLSG